MKVYLETLGCAKNAADSRELRRSLYRSGLLVSSTPEKADTVIVNTCAFIRSAVDESLEVIFTHLHSDRRVWVTGCLNGRYGDRIKELLPEVQGFFPFEDQCRAGEILSGRTIIKKNSKPDQPDVWEYVKVSDGCDRTCSFCTIPSIRGPFKSRPLPLIRKEIKGLVADGVREIILVAQDLTAWGKEWGQRLNDLLHSLSGLKGDFRIRPLYLLPSAVSVDLAESMLRQKKVIPYFDLPVQHCTSRILKAMNRSVDMKKFLELMNFLTASAPDHIKRATLMTGFPGETEKDHQQVMKFVAKMRFHHLGVFIFSPEEGTKAAILKPVIHHSTARRRQKEIMELQREISAEHLSAFRGRILKGWIEAQESRGVFRIRQDYFTPEVDGMLLAEGKPDLKPGTPVRILIKQSGEYDLYGEIV